MTEEMQTFCTTASSVIIFCFWVISFLSFSSLNRQRLKKEQLTEKEIDEATKALNFFALGIFLFLFLPALIWLLFISPLGVLAGFFLWYYTHEKTTPLIHQLVSIVFK